MESDPAVPPRTAALPRCAEAMDELVLRLREAGALGVLVVDASPLGQVERFWGPEAHARLTCGLAAALDEASAGQRGSSDCLVQGDEERDEVAIFFFRPRADAAFYRDALPALAASLDEHLVKLSSRLFYPYLRGGVRLPIGYAVALRNPIVSEARQVRSAVAEARADARFAAEWEVREGRRRFLHILLAEDVTILFEPIVNLATRDVIGHEALARGPAGSDVETPTSFFRRAEASGLLFEADSLCRRRALDAARGLPAGRKLFLNCLPSAIRDPQFRGAALRQTLERLRLRPTDVVFEISERESIGNFELFREARDHFASLGLGIALDDTGAGYSSLEAVMELAPDFIKVDQALVRSIDSDPPRQELVRALNAVAAKLDARLIAEGIETREELETLQSLGVPLGQGYLLGRAAPLRRET